MDVSSLDCEPDGLEELQVSDNSPKSDDTGSNSEYSLRSDAIMDDSSSRCTDSSDEHMYGAESNIDNDKTSCLKSTEHKGKPLSIIREVAIARDALAILMLHKVLGFDTEFGNENSCEGNILSLLQFATLTGETYVFDVLCEKQKEVLKLPELKEILTSKDILKVMHGCTNDSILLYEAAGIEMQNVFDTQVFQKIVEMRNQPESNPKQTSLEVLCKQFDVPKSPKIENMWHKCLDRYPSDGSIPQDVLYYSVDDARCLIPLWEKMKNKHGILEDFWEGHFRDMVYESVSKNLDFDDEKKNMENKVKCKRQKEQRKKEIKELQLSSSG